MRKLYKKNSAMESRMLRRFDRADPQCRMLKQRYASLADELSSVAQRLRQEIHQNFYPDFGMISGQPRRDVLKPLLLWKTIFKDFGESIFTLSFEIEKNLVDNIAYDPDHEYRNIFKSIQDRKGDTDKLLRILNTKVNGFYHEDPLNSEMVYNFCELIERTAHFFRFASATLLNPKSDIGREYLGVDWDTVFQSIQPT